MKLLDWLHGQARARPAHAAVIAPEGTCTFSELDGRVEVTARRLRQAGIGPGMRVAGLLGNGLPLVELIHAVPRTGAALVLLDPRLTAAELRAQVTRTGPGLVLADATTAPLARAAGVEPTTDLGAWQAAGTEPPRIDLDTPHTVVFTSGSAGVPKPVVLTAGNHLWSAIGSAERLGMRADDRWLACLPLWHVGGLAIVLRGAILGATVLVHPRFEADAVAEALDAQQATLVSLVPTALTRLLGSLGPRRAPARLRCALIGGAASPLTLLREAAARGWRVAATYGCTEAASQIATAAPGTVPSQPGEVGRPLHPTRVRVVRDDGVPAADDEAGEIEIQGPTVSPGLLAPDGSIRPLGKGGWLGTGDIGRRAADGTLTVVGRRDELIVTGGENVAPAEVEGVLAELPGVAEVAVAGVADAEWGEVVAAWVVPAADARLTLEALREAARHRLAPHKLPRRLHLLDALPRTASGKVQRAALRAGAGRPGSARGAAR